MNGAALMALLVFEGVVALILGSLEGDEITVSPRTGPGNAENASPLLPVPWNPCARATSRPV